MLSKKYYVSSLLGLSLLMSPLASAMMPGTPYQHGHEYGYVGYVYRDGAMHHSHYHPYHAFGWYHKPWFYRQPARVIVVNPGYPSPNIVIIRRH